ncbi:kinase PVPK-1 [Spatholobus suberectus]|nr:kinase PVPK-1 [Spatholobus suberectus]
MNSEEGFVWVFVAAGNPTLWRAVRLGRLLSPIVLFEIPFMESHVNGVESLSEVQNSVSGEHHDPTSTYGTPRPSQPPLRASRNHGAGHQTKTIHHQNSHAINKSIPMRRATMWVMKDCQQNCAASKHLMI